MRTITWGTIGCGDVCERKSGPPLYQVPHSRLAAVCRRDREKAADFARRHKVPRFYDRVEDLLADGEVEAVYVATPDRTHLAPVLAAIAAGKHVLCEKPMANNAAECRRMIDAATARGVALGVAYYRRCYPSILRAKAMLADGAVGRPRRLWINDEFPDSHRLDLVHFFCGDVVEAWASVEKLPGGSCADAGPVLHCRNAEGVESCTHLGWQEKLLPETLTFEGDAGRLVVEDLKAGKLLLDRGGRQERIDCGPLPWMHWGLIENFVQHLNGLAPLACDGVEGRKSTVILDVVAGLPHDGTRVRVDYA
jgi:predicted dehydrogenase